MHPVHKAILGRSNGSLQIRRNLLLIRWPIQFSSFLVVSYHLLSCYVRLVLVVVDYHRVLEDRLCVQPHLVKNSKSWTGQNQISCLILDIVRYIEYFLVRCDLNLSHFF